MDRARHLTLDGLTVNRRLARRLAPIVACRYHALPVAEANGHITVAMANPDDPVAREAVASALGAPSYLVKGNSTVIDALLAELWPGVLQRSPRLLVCAHGNPIADEVSHYALALGDLLDARVGHFCPKDNMPNCCDTLVREVERSEYDLVAWGEPRHCLGREWLSGPAYCQALERIPTSLLFVRRPRLPLRRLLLIVRDQETDSLALNWTVQLAQPSGANVTVLAVVPPVPAFYDGCRRMQLSLDALLTTDTHLGQQMRRVAQCLVDWEIDGRLRLRQGDSEVQIQYEIAQGDYDLITIAATSRDQWERWLMRGPLISLLRWVDRPVLVARPSSRDNRAADQELNWTGTDQPPTSPT